VLSLNGISSERAKMLLGASDNVN